MSESHAESHAMQWPVFMVLGVKLHPLITRPRKAV